MSVTPGFHVLLSQLTRLPRRQSRPSTLHPHSAAARLPRNGHLPSPFFILSAAPPAAALKERQALRDEASTPDAASAPDGAPAPDAPFPGDARRPPITGPGLIVLLLALFAFGMSAFLSRTVFERLPHLEDEMAYLWGARAIAGGNFVLPSPQPTRAYWQPFLVDRGGVRFSKYQPGWSLQLAAGVLMGQVWFVNAAFAALTVPLVYRIGRDGFGRCRFGPARSARGVSGETAGLIAAALIAWSPAALLLNATLMGHTAALFGTALFLVALLHIDRWHGRPRRALMWGVAAGIALGLLALNRPLTAIAIGVPGALWTLAKLARRADSISLGAAVRAVPPYLALTACALALAAIIPIYNYQAAGDPRANLYTFVWEYDTVGFGPCCGRSGHTLEKGVRHTRFDLSLTAADLFGWTAPVTDASGQVRADLVDHWVNQADYLPIHGWSWVLLPLGLLVAFGVVRGIGIGLWIAAGVAILALPFGGDGALSRIPAVGYAMVIGLLAWANLPVLLLRDRRRAWAYVLVATALGLVIVQLAYWIGSQRYSTRYYYEGLIGAAIITALPIAWLLARLRRIPVVRAAGIAAVIGVLVYSLFAYSLPRIATLHGFNLINRQLVDEVEARREGDRPVLVLVNGENVRWRAYAPLMAQTSPYLDSPIVAARAATPAERDAVLAQFPNRQIIEMDAVENQAWFRDAE